MYTDLYLKFTDEAESTSVLYTLYPATLDEDGATVSEEYTKPNYTNIDVIGTLYDTPVEKDTAPVALDGWHVNVRVVDGEDLEALAPYAVVPTVPRRVWG